jgi:hypothetical protein
MQINGKEFKVTKFDGEVFYHHVNGKLSQQELTKIVSKLNLSDKVKVFDAENGVFSVYK